MAAKKLKRLEADRLGQRLKRFDMALLLVKKVKEKIARRTIGAKGYYFLTSNNKMLRQVGS